VVQSARGGGISEAAQQRIDALPRIQQAVVWSELLGKPKALRRSPDPWEG
jgi:hypothetical protein